jgi:hypothetical protein
MGSFIGVALLAGKIATLVGAGFGVATAFELFHEKELKFKKKGNKEEGASNDDQVEHLRKKFSGTR